MASKTIKVRAREKDGVTTVKALMSHPMETGARKDAKTGKLVPAHFIQEVTCEHRGNTVLNAHWGGGVSKNPYFSFKFKGAKKGDEIKLSWLDNKGDSDAIVAEIK